MLEIVPMTLKEANAFVEQNHRHHGKVAGHKFSIGLSDGEKIVGVAIVGRPVARHHEMTDDDHVELLAALKAHQGTVLISGYPSELYDRELAGWHRETATATDQTSRVRQEVLWMNFDPHGQERWF